MSVIITNYNYASFVGEAVESALLQKGARVEVIVVDDGSTDASLDVLARFGDRIRLIAQHNTGQGGAFNVGIQNARADICCLLDADDRMRPGRARALTAVAEAHPDAGLLIHQVQKIDNTGAPLGSPTPASLPAGHIWRLLDRSGGYWPCPPTSGLAFRRSALSKLLPIPEWDWRICADAYLFGLAPYVTSVASIDEALSEYRIHGSNYWASSPAVASRTSDSLIEQARAIKERHQRIAHHARTIGIRVKSRVEDHYQYQFISAEIGSLSSLWRLARMAIRRPPFVSARDAAKAPIGVLRRRVATAVRRLRGG